MNALEFWLMNNPLRSFVQKFEAKKMKWLSELPPGRRVLEIGCGQGEGVKLICRYFRPAQVDAIDLDPAMIQRARGRIGMKNVSFAVGDVAALNFPTGSFDAIFDFGILHHVPNWHKALAELFRVLKPGGLLIAEDLSADTFTTVLGRVLKKLLRHPYEKMYTTAEFFKEMESLGFVIQKQEKNAYWFTFVARK